MRGVSGTATAKALIVAAIPVGLTGLVVSEPWAVASIVASLVLVAAGGALWWWTVRRDRRWLYLRRTGEPGGPATRDGGTHPDALDDFYDSELQVYASRPVRRHQLMVSNTSRVRRAGMRRGMARIAQLAEVVERKSRREQLWWLVAGLAASIPIGVAINLVTG
ncbi:hypothetical protein ABZU25_13120 [Micromonospora sp. NPDC005215]|uniref:hypothetical protein n=1 Tax=Micromonospora sp. NPDC005215 TaxID=3157024 RepID=UPI0033B5553A